MEPQMMYFPLQFPSYFVQMPLIYCNLPYLDKYQIEVQLQKPTHYSDNKNIKEEKPKHNETKLRKNCSQIQQFQLNVEDQIQKLNRENKNILPNTIQMILSYLKRIVRSSKTIKKIIQSFLGHQKQIHDIEQLIKKFFSYQIIRIQQLHIHKKDDLLKILLTMVNPKCSTFNIQQQKFFNKIARTFVRYLLQNQILINALISKKILNKNKKGHLKLQRILLKYLLQQKQII